MYVAYNKSSDAPQENTRAAPTINSSKPSSIAEWNKYILEYLHKIR